MTKRDDKSYKSLINFWKDIETKNTKEENTTTKPTTYQEKAVVTEKSQNRNILMEESKPNNKEKTVDIKRESEVPSAKQISIQGDNQLKGTEGTGEPKYINSESSKKLTDNAESRGALNKGSRREERNISNSVSNKGEASSFVKPVQPKEVKRKPHTALPVNDKKQKEAGQTNMKDNSTICDVKEMKLGTKKKTEFEKAAVPKKPEFDKATVSDTTEFEKAAVPKKPEFDKATVSDTTEFEKAAGPKKPEFDKDAVSEKPVFEKTAPKKTEEEKHENLKNPEEEKTLNKPKFNENIKQPPLKNVFEQIKDSQKILNDCKNTLKECKEENIKTEQEIQKNLNNLNTKIADEEIIPKEPDAPQDTRRFRKRRVTIIDPNIMKLALETTEAERMDEEKRKSMELTKEEVATYKGEPIIKEEVDLKEEEPSKSRRSRESRKSIINVNDLQMKQPITTQAKEDCLLTKEQQVFKENDNLASISIADLKKEANPRSRGRRMSVIDLAKMYSNKSDEEGL